MENTIFRRSHLTARLDNHIGRCALGQAYDHFGLERQQILSDSPLMHMAITTLHQTALITRHMDEIPASRRLQLSFETTLESPTSVLDDFAAFAALPIQSRTLAEIIDRPRGSSNLEPFNHVDVAEVQSMMSHLQARGPQ